LNLQPIGGFRANPLFKADETLKHRNSTRAPEGLITGFETNNEFTDASVGDWLPLRLFSRISRTV